MAVNALTPDQIAAQKAQSGQGPQPGQTIGTATPGGQAPSGTPMAKQQASNLATQQQQGSGRFTNIQKYLNANQAGGKQIANQVGQGLNKEYGQQSEQAQKYYTQLGQNIANANQVAQQGAGFQNQLKDIGNQIGQAQQAGFDQRGQQNQTLGGIEAFTNQPNFNQFQNIQAGRGIDESLLALQQQRSAQAAQAAAQGTQAAQQALGSETGRFDLLRKTLGNSPSYSQGQQRLDQALLGQGGGLGSVQAQTSANARAAAQQAKLAGSKILDVNRLTAQEQGLIGDINSQAGANEKAYVDMLGSYIDPTNLQRTKEFEDLNSAVQTYRPQVDAQGKPLANQAYQSGFNADQMARLGLNDQNQGVYNVFNNDVMNANDIVTQGRQAQNAQDIANASDVNRYAALSKIIGANAPNQITQASDLGASYVNKEGDAALANRLTAAQKQFEDMDKLNFSKIGITGTGSASQLINQGRTPVTDIRDAAGNQINPGAQFGTGNGDKFGAFQNMLNPEMINSLQNLIKNQNYNRTIGGRRETFLDTEKAAKLAKQGITPKINDVPITGVDPSIAYTNALKGLKK